LNIGGDVVFKRVYLFGVFTLSTLNAKEKEISTLMEGRVSVRGFINEQSDKYNLLL